MAAYNNNNGSGIFNRLPTMGVNANLVQRSNSSSQLNRQNKSGGLAQMRSLDAKNHHHVPVS